MRNSTIFTIAILAAALTVMAVSLGYPSDARLFPLAISIAVAVLAVTIIISEVFFKDVHGKVYPEKRSDADAHKLISAPVWIASLLLLIYLLGFLVGTPIFIFLYLRLHHETWLLSLGISAMMAAIVYGVFIFALEVFLYEGALFIALK